MQEVFDPAKYVFNTERLGFPKNLEIIPPASVEIFLNGLGNKTHLPAEIAGNTRLLEQSSERRNLYLSVSNIFEKVSDVSMDLDKALDKGIVHAEEVTTMYEQLSDLIEKDENNTRVILYLPFQLIPGVDGKKESERLTNAQDRFKDVCKNAWIRLLHESEPRASFVDGDVLEPGMGTPPRIRKAAHLIPDLLQKGVLITDDVIEQFDLSSNEELSRSLLEGIIVARDKQLITDADWQTIQNLCKAKSATVDVSQRSNEKHDKLEDKSFEDITIKLDADLAEIDTKYAENSPYTSTISPERAKWEKGVKQDEAIDKAANNIAQQLQSGEMEVKEIEVFGHTEDYNKALIRGITKAAESYSGADLQRAKKLAENSQELIQKLWDSGSSGIKDIIVSTMCHWRRLGIIEDEELKKLGINLPDLSSPFPVNLEELIKTDLQGAIDITRRIKESPSLSESVYPFMLAFGSRLKGYAGLNADLDGAIFVKPTVSWEKREAILRQLHQEIPEVKDLGKILEFWVEEKEGKLGFRIIPEGTETVIGSPQIHFLIGGAWVSQSKDYQQLYGDMIKKYLDLSRFGEQKDQVRTQLLGQIELDILQYRLMHKGYRKYYPNKRGEGTEHADLIDWESDFWDPGYRRIATQLFLSRVFLPDLSSDPVKKSDESAGR